MMLTPPASYCEPALSLSRGDKKRECAQSTHCQTHVAMLALSMVLHFFLLVTSVTICGVGQLHWNKPVTICGVGQLHWNKPVTICGVGQLHWNKPDIEKQT